MTLQFGSGGGTPSFTNAPTSGVPSIAVGTGTFAGGAAPDFQGISAIGVNMAAGYAQNLLALQIAGIPKFTINSLGSITLVNALTTQTTLTAGPGAHTFNGVSSFVSNAAVNSPLLTKGFALQTADLFSAQDSGPVNHFGVANIGTGGSPIWCMRVAPVANAASMAQAHAGGASTGKAIQVIDNSGTTIGWLQLLA